MKEFPGFPVLRGTQVETTGTAPVFEPGTIFAVRNATTGFWSLAKYVQLGTQGVSQGEVCVTNYATLSNDSVRQSVAATDGRAPHLRGIAAATIATNSYGFMYIGGYVEKADLSHTAASGELLCISGSTAGKLTPDGASSFWAATVGVSSALGSAPFAFAVARTAIATGVGSVSILGVWG